jgi:hypothetical protein
MAHPRQTEDYLNCVIRLLMDLPTNMKVMELCGGIGLIASVLSHSLRPLSWTCVELDKSCEVAFLKDSGAEFILGDMYDQRSYAGYDLVICEFPTNTLPKMWREPKRAKLLSSIANDRPKYWYIADVGSYWCHLENHRPAYMEYFHDKPTKNNYHEYFDKYMMEQFNYRMIRHQRGGGASYFLMERMS